MAKKMKMKSAKKMDKAMGEAKPGTKPSHPSKASFAKREKRLEGKPL